MRPVLHNTDIYQIKHEKKIQRTFPLFATALDFPMFFNSRSLHPVCFHLCQMKP